MNGPAGDLPPASRISRNHSEEYLRCFKIVSKKIGEEEIGEKWSGCGLRIFEGNWVCQYQNLKVTRKVQKKKKTHKARSF